MVDSYLEDRCVRLRYAGAECRRVTTKGCVQGSIGGPTFWNLLLDPLLRDLEGGDLRGQAFADDVVLVISGDNEPVIMYAASAWAPAASKLGVRKELDTVQRGFAQKLVKAYRTVSLNSALLLAGLLPLDLRIQEAAALYEVKRGYSQRVVGDRGVEVPVPVVSAPHPVDQVGQVIEPIITYAAGIWGDAVRYKKVRRKLISLQRGFAIRVVRGFRTISANAAIALAQFTPLDLKVKAVRTVERARLTSRSPYLPADVRLHRPTPPSQLAHPADRLGITFSTAYTEEDVDRACSTMHTRIYTDGSKLDGGEVGAAFVVFRPDHQPVVRKLKLHDSCTVFQAELLAIERAIIWASDRHLMDIAVLSDSHSALQELENPASTNSIATLVHTHIRNHPGSIEFVWVKAHAGLMGNEAADAAAKSAALLHRTPDFALFPISHVKRRVREDHHTTHNNRYTTSDKGVHTREWLPDLNSIDTLFKHTNHTFSLTQILTGHGFHRYYLHRFKITHTDKCNCNPNAIQTIEHLIKTCPRYASARDRHERLCSYLDLDPYALQALTTKERALESFLEYVKHIVDTLKEYNST
ncbi:hypothetical protein ABMA27_002934 [Loxostege sticticalis]|uniref:RNase H type-1 domain-containing protein n=1 Tax=Loxostege sticticalis TaxID=481309 RepID=A0ABR3HRM2_LOXSC